MKSFNKLCNRHQNEGEMHFLQRLWTDIPSEQVVPSLLTVQGHQHHTGQPGLLVWLRSLVSPYSLNCRAYFQS